MILAEMKLLYELFLHQIITFLHINREELKKEESKLKLETKLKKITKLDA